MYLEQNTYVAPWVTVYESDFSQTTSVTYVGSCRLQRPALGLSSLSSAHSSLKLGQLKQCHAKFLNDAVRFIQGIPEVQIFPSVTLRLRRTGAIQTSPSLTTQTWLPIFEHLRSNAKTLATLILFTMRLGKVVAWTDPCFRQNFAYAVGHDLSKITGKRVPILLFTDSRSIFDTTIKLSRVSEKRLFIHISCLRNAYAQGDIETFGRVSFEYNSTDSLTNKMHSKFYLLKSIPSSWKTLSNSA